MTNKKTLSSLVNEQLEATRNFLLSERKGSLKEELRLFYEDEASKMPFLVSVAIVVSYNTGLILSHYLSNYIFQLKCRN